MTERLYPYRKESVCVKCGSGWTTNPWWHARWGRYFFSSSFPFLRACKGFSLDHLHYVCHSCGFSYAMACADVREEIQRETGI